MKSIVLLITFLSVCLGFSAQKNDTEATIRTLVQKERQATLQKDTATLRTIWSEDFTVNAPINWVIQGGKNTLERPVITQLNYTSFERNVE